MTPTDPLDPGALTREQLDEIARQVFPIRSENGLVTLEIVESTEREGAHLGILVRLVIRERIGEDVSIRDLKEQEILLLGPVERREPARVANLFRAFGRVLPAALAAPDIEYLVPHDLLGTDVLRLRRAETEEDFVKALRAKTRLGRFLPDPATGT